MIWFSVRSLFTRYGWAFIRYIALPHPFRTIRAFSRARRITKEKSGSVSVVGGSAALPHRGGEIVGAGFCLKPAENRCPSKSDLHGCRYLETCRFQSETKRPAVCANCYIASIGAAALQDGRAFYVMTSARDILFDVFKPALEKGTFRHGIFMLCRYSFKPFATGMLAAGIDGKLAAFCDGDCRDYKTWLKADNGIKKEQTVLDGQTRTELEKEITGDTGGAKRVTKAERRGNIYYPVC